MNCTSLFYSMIWLMRLAKIYPEEQLLINYYIMKFAFTVTINPKYA